MNKLSKKDLFILVLLLCCVPLVGAESAFMQASVPARVVETAGEKLSLESAITLALKESEDLQISENEILKLNAQYRDVRAEIYPQIEGVSSWQRNIKYPRNGLTEDYASVNSIEVNQLLWAFGRVKSAVNAAREAVLVNFFNKEKTKQDVIFSAKQAYYLALLSEETLRITQASYENATMNKTILENRSSSGRVSKRDIIKMDADIAARLPQVTAARRQYVSSLNTLRIITGFSVNREFNLSERFAEKYAPVNFEELKERMFFSEPYIKALEKQVLFKEELIRQQKAGHYPTVKAFMDYAYNGSDDAGLLGSGNTDSNASAGVKVTVPIFTGWRTTAKIDQAVADRDNAKLTLQKEKEKFLLQLENTVSDYHEYIATYKANQQAVQLAEQAFELTQELFASGLSTLTDLNDAELQLTNQKLQLEQTLYNINISMALIEQLTQAAEETV